MTREKRAACEVELGNQATPDPHMPVVPTLTLTLLFKHHKGPGDLMLLVIKEWLMHGEGYSRSLARFLKKHRRDSVLWGPVLTTCSAIRRFERPWQT